MANRAYLLNTSVLTSDPYQLERLLAEPGNDYLEAAEAAYKLPVPWLCCFRAGDLKPVTFTVTDFDGNENSLTLALPSTTVHQAIANLEQTRPLFAQITGETVLAERYWSDALRHLQALPLPCLALNPIEVLLTFDPEDAAADLALGLAGDASAVPYLKDFAGYTDGALPYPPDVLRTVPGPHHDEQRLDNAVALDDHMDGFWHLSPGSARAPDERLALPADRGSRNLDNLLGFVGALLKMRDPQARATFGFMPLEPGRPERLKLLISAATDAQRDSLLKDLRLRTELEGHVEGELRTLCQAYGIAWRGVVFESGPSLRRQYPDDLNQWVNLPPTPPLKLSAL